jgi:hypothetical protein
MTAPVETGFTINPKLYDFLKWLNLVMFPATVTLLLGVGILFGGSGWTIAAGVVTLLEVFLGSLVKQSSKNYARQQTFGDLVVGLDEQGNAEVKTLRANVEEPIFRVGSKMTVNVVQDHTIPRQ